MRNWNRSARGRVRVVGMNKVETAYGQHLELRKQVGEVQWYAYEGMKFRLADNTFYTPDFAVMLADGMLEAHEVKGGKKLPPSKEHPEGRYTYWAEEDGKMKIKIAADLFPLRFIIVFPLPANAGGGWGSWIA